MKKAVDKMPAMKDERREFYKNMIDEALRKVRPSEDPDSKINKLLARKPTPIYTSITATPEGSRNPGKLPLEGADADTDGAAGLPTDDAEAGPSISKEEEAPPEKEVPSMEIPEHGPAEVHLHKHTYFQGA